MTRLALLLAAAGVAALAAAGPASLGRLALMAGLPGLAAPLIADPAVKGVALYEAGRYPEADDAFRTAGRGSTYNRGLSLAATGDYPLSRAYFDAIKRLKGETIEMTVPSDRRGIFGKLFGRRVA